MVRLINEFGEKVATSGDVDMSLMVNNPAFDKDFIARQFAFGFSLPNLGNGNDNHLYADSFNSTEIWHLEVGGVPYFSGNFSLKNKKDNTFEVSYQDKEIAFLEKLNSLKINEVLETIDFSADFKGIRLSCQSAFNQPVTYSVTINGTQFQHTEQFSPGMSALAATALNTQINLVFPNFSKVQGTTIIFDNYSDYKEFNVNNNTVNNLTVNFFETPVSFGEQRWREFADATGNSPDARVCFPMVRNDDFFEGKNDLYIKYVNYALNDFTKNTTHSSLSAITTIVPFVRVSYIIQRISQAIGVPIFFEGIENIEELCLLNTRSLDVASLDFHDSPFSGLSSLGTKLWLMGYKISCNLNDHVPSLSAKEFLLGLCQDNLLKVELLDGNIKISPFSKHFKRKSLDLTKYAQTDFILNVSKHEGFEIVYTKEKEDSFEKLPNLEQGLKEFKFNLSFNAIKMTVPAFPNSYNLRMPEMRQGGTSQSFGLTHKTESLRLLRYKGKKPIPNSNGFLTYLYATSDQKNQEGFDEYSSSLQIEDGNVGLSETLIPFIFYLKSEKKISKSLTLPIGLFHRIASEGYFNVLLRHPKGDVAGVIKTLKVKASNKTYGFVEADAEIYIL